MLTLAYLLSYISNLFFHLKTIAINYPSYLVFTSPLRMLKKVQQNVKCGKHFLLLIQSYCQLAITTYQKTDFLTDRLCFQTQKGHLFAVDVQRIRGGHMTYFDSIDVDLVFDFVANGPSDLTLLSAAQQDVIKL